ncbi:MAG: molybdopterin-binding protein [Alsobacter sp.]
MQFGRMALDGALGAVCVHSVRLPDGLVRKGTLLGEAEIGRLRAAGIEVVVAARLEPGDIGEDEAAARLAAAVAGPAVRVEKAFTGRANLYAEADGVLLLDEAAIVAVNGVDEAVTFATLPAHKAVVTGEMIGTVKIIPFAVPGGTLDKALAATGGTALIRVAPFRLRKVGVVSTILPGLKPSVVRKTVSVLQQRLDPAGARVLADFQTPHETEPLAKALQDLAAGESELLVVFGASAITDRRDVIPAAIEAAGGRVEHFGMPVDPGNLLLIGEIAGRPVLGAPGCARSPKENGFDWILQRLLAQVPVRRADIAALGVGGLLMEIVQRGQLREASPEGEE